MTQAKLFLSTSLIAVGVATATPSFAQDSDLSLSANVAVVSDYRFRGVSLSQEDVAIQGGLDAGYKGFYVGTWGSSIENFNGAEAEIDVYGGYSFDVDAVTLDIGVIGYLYPGGTGTDYLEVYGSVGFSLADVGFTVGANYAPDQGNIGGTDNIYIYTSAEYAIPDTALSLTGSIGYEDGAFGDDKIDWLIGASYGYQQFSLGVSYVDTNDFDGAVVVSLGASF
ncbi:MAG: TorF family putative porin [Sphingomonadales bacterium]